MYLVISKTGYNFFYNIWFLKKLYIAKKLIFLLFQLYTLFFIIHYKQTMSLLQNSTLKSVKVSGEIYDSIGQFDVEQIYLSTNENPLEIFYQFALDNNSIITNVSLQIGDKKLYGILNEKQQNRLNYDKAIENKNTALTLEKNPWGDYVLKLGNIEPNINIIVKYTYITYLKIVNSTFIYNLPTNIAQRYQQKTIEIEQEIFEPNHLEYSSDCNFNFNINILIKSSNIIKNIDCNCLESKLSKISDTEYLINTNTVPKFGDFVITFNTELKPCAYKYKNYYAINFNFPTQNDKSDIPKSYSIIVDRSGSMDGSKMDNAKEALKLFVSSLPKESYFNIISFGSSYMGLYESPVIYTDKNIKFALDHINSMNANMGGTELYKCLEDSIRQRLEFYQEKKWLSESVPTECENIIIILTDGQVSGSNLKTIISKYSDKKFRIFTLGIGQDANKTELESIANRGYGVCRMSSEAKDIADNVIDILDYCNKIYYKNIKYNNDVILKCAYPNVFTQAFIKLENQDDNIILKSNLVEFNIKPENIEKGKLISQFYMDYQIKNDLINYNDVILNSIKYSLLTDKTSFFLYNSDKIKTEGELEQETVKHYSNGLEDQCCIMENLSSQRAQIVRCSASLCDLQDMSGTVSGGATRFEKKSVKLSSSSGWFYSRESSRSKWCSKEIKEDSEPSMFGKAYDSISKGIGKLFTKQLTKEEIKQKEMHDKIMRKNKTDELRKKYGLLDDDYNKTIIDYKLADGSFELNDDLINLCNYETDKFYELSTKLKITPKILINYIVLIKLENLKENKYKLIIQNLISFLIENDKDNYVKNYEIVKNN